MCKALEYWKKIDNDWFQAVSVDRFKEKYKAEKDIRLKKMGEFIDNSYVFFGRDGGDLYEAIHNNVLCDLRKEYSDVEIAKMLNTTIPTDKLQIDKDGNIIYIDHNPHSDYYYEYIDGEVNATLCDIQIAYDIGGKSAIKELKKIYKHIDNKIYDYFLTTQTNAYMEKEIYGDDNMVDIFFEKLSQLNYGEDIFVFWDGDYSENGFGTMYINDESEHQAQETTTLFEAYRFAILINACDFDYVASDEMVKDFGEQLLDLVDDEFYKINVWEYLDDIAEDFKALTGKTINSIDYKRMIVSYMSEVSDVDCGLGFGSATFIARLLSDNILGDDRNNVKGCNNPTAIKLAESFLKIGDYDLNKFADALHQTNVKMETPQTFMEYLTMANGISEQCYYLLQQLIKNNREYENDILVGYIDWFGDYKEDDRYIYCHINSIDNEIYFYQSRRYASPKSAYLHDIAFPHLISDNDRIQKDIEIKFTDKYIQKELENKMYEMYGVKGSDIYESSDWGYVHCLMYGTTGSIV